MDERRKALCSNSVARIKVLALVLCLLFASIKGEAESAVPPSGDQAVLRQALYLMETCAFHSEYGAGAEGQNLNRWEKELTIWVGGRPTREDKETLDAFLSELQEKVPGFPTARRVSRDDQADIWIWFVPEDQIAYYFDDYAEENWGFFHYDQEDGKITKARIAVAMDITDQEARNHLIKEELVGALGLPGDHLLYPDSILYDPWTTVQELSPVDWDMLTLLYSPVVSPNMTWDQALSAWQTWLGW